MSTLELDTFESIPAGNGMALLRLSGRWPREAESGDRGATLVIELDGDTRELDPLPEPGLSGEGGLRSAAFAVPSELESSATGFALAVGELLFDLPSGPSNGDMDHEPAKPQREDADPSPARRVRLPAAKRLPAPRLPSLRLPRLELAQLRLPSVRAPRLEGWGREELQVMVAGAALGAACATVVLIELVP